MTRLFIASFRYRYYCLGVTLLGFCLCSCGIGHHNRILDTVDYPSEIREQRVAVTGKPTFTKVDDYWELSIEGLDPKRYRYLSWPVAAEDPSSLDTSKEWHFEILHQESEIYDFSRTELLKASLDEEIIYDSSMCEVHHRKMNRVVEVCDEYGDRMKPMGYEHFYRVRMAQFPHSGTSFPICTEYPGRELTWRCPECKAAAKRWGDRHLMNQPAI